MSYKLIIADDEEKIRTSLAKYIPWGDYGFEVVGVFSDGREVLEYIDKYSVDVVFTDIKMTFVSGLELSEYIFKNNLPIKVVILSGYQEFEYARKAIEFKVVDYLLKPTVSEDIERVFTSIAASLEENKKSENYKEKFKTLVELAREEFFNDLILGAIKNPVDYEQNFKKMDIDVDPANYYCSIIKIRVKDWEQYMQEKWNYGKDELYLALRNVIYTHKEKFYIIPFHNDTNGIDAVFISERSDKSAELSHEPMKYLKASQNELKKTFDLEIDVIISKQYTNLIEMASDSMQNYSKTGVEEEFIKEVEEEFIKGLEEEVIINDEEFSEHKKLVLSYINAGNFTAVSNILDKIFNKLMQKGIKFAKDYILDTFLNLEGKLKEIGIIGSNELQLDYGSLIQSESTQIVKQWIKSSLSRVMDISQQRRESSENRIIAKAKEYVNNNYNKEISLEDVADNVYISSVYLSKLFKSVTGENFIDYLISVRMRKAMELLQENEYKAYEICGIVGYKSFRHFNNLFKNHTGYTPTEYRRKILKKI